MDAFILVFTLGIMLAIGVPVAYAVGISAIIGAWYIDIPLEAVMIQLTSGGEQVFATGDPVLYFGRGLLWPKGALRGGW
ncbi:2,3-diketo-L-gulonate TRAP transporter large permease [Citrobacter braakii]|nr:2,3-diketo-L-gulonate TRAP transporter large permease [Citrobacter braakii]